MITPWIKYIANLIISIQFTAPSTHTSHCIICTKVSSHHWHTCHPISTYFALHHKHTIHIEASTYTQHCTIGTQVSQLANTSHHTISTQFTLQYQYAYHIKSSAYMHIASMQTCHIVHHYHLSHTSSLYHQHASFLNFS